MKIWIPLLLSLALQSFADPPNSSWPLIFGDDFNDASVIDSSATGQLGHPWHSQMFWGFGSVNSASHFSVNGGILSFVQTLNNNWNDGIKSAFPANNAQGWEGVGFQIGSGIYFEASIAMLNVSQIGAAGWPSFWLDSIHRETGIGFTSTSGGSEIDALEYNPTWYGTTQAYFTALHDWSGDHGADFTTNASITPGVFHRYGLLLDGKGNAQAFFDGTPGNTLPLFAPMNNDLYMVILGCSTPNEMQVDWCRVWAADPNASLVQMPAAQPTPTPAGTPTPTPSSTPTPTPGGTPTPTPLGTPTPSPTISPSPTPSATPQPMRRRHRHWWASLWQRITQMFLPSIDIKSAL